jgi:acetylornithine deacetylase/succinyl-diaminopimelate desuccinylase-like protein
MTAATLALLAWAGIVATAPSSEPPATPRCAVFEISAVGRGAHGATVMRDSAPHRLIRALDRVPAWRAATPYATAVRIVALEAAPAINVIPRRATALVELRLAIAVRLDRVARDLGGSLGPEVAVGLADRPCAP